MVTREIRTEIVIQAPAKRVWDVLTDTASFWEWNPFIVSVAGEFGRGERPSVIIKPPGRRKLAFRPKVLDAEPHRRLRWKGRTGLPGLLDGEHVHEIQPLDNGRVRYVHRERFRGVLVPFARRMLEDTATGFEQMNLAVKKRSEAPGRLSDTTRSRGVGPGRV